jgi:hypothetical protein
MKVKCPKCGAEVPLVRFGFGWVAHCCGEIICNSRDSSGKLFVACSECNRGGNGDDKDKCSCGFRVKKWNGLGCYLGILLEGLEVKP